MCHGSYARKNWGKTILEEHWKCKNTGVKEVGVVLDISSMITAPLTTFPLPSPGLEIKVKLCSLDFRAPSYLVWFCESDWVGIKNFPSPFFCAPDEGDQYSSIQKWGMGEKSWINKMEPFNYRATAWNLGQQRTEWPRKATHFCRGNYRKASVSHNIKSPMLSTSVHWFWAMNNDKNQNLHNSPTKSLSSLIFYTFQSRAHLRKEVQELCSKSTQYPQIGIRELGRKWLVKSHWVSKTESKE